MACLLLGSAGCSLGPILSYDTVPWPEERILKDLPYWDGDGADAEKHRLDLYLPSASLGGGWPTLIFIHGGGWTDGDKDLEAYGRDVYSNIGRLYASKGIGTAVINYRLQPSVGWREQVRDVARAVAWVHRNIAEHGGDPGSIFATGHSAGAYFSAFVALAPWPLEEQGLGPQVLCGVAPVSGVAFDLEDEETWRLGAALEYYEIRFAPGEGDDWRKTTSVVTHLSRSAPPFFIAYADGEWPALQHQNRLLGERLREAGASVQMWVVEEQGHRQMAATLSQDDEALTGELARFVQDTPCTEAASGTPP
ncbi:MAG: alpha/beta hydrolase [Acidobacteriota bacterium]